MGEPLFELARGANVLEPRDLFVWHVQLGLDGDRSPGCGGGQRDELVLMAIHQGLHILGGPHAQDLADVALL